ncbi:MAG: hypothetical protein IKP22_09340 [Clostridia bacterium]|nr:hypothetical protein [Clostridia bacterium]
MKTRTEVHLLKGRHTGPMVSFGTMWPRGQVKEAVFTLESGGREVPASAEAAAFWPDGSVKWARHTALSAYLGEKTVVTAGTDDEDMCPAKAGNEAGDKVRTEKGPGGWTIDAGRLKMRVPPAGGDTLLCDIRLENTVRIRAVKPVFFMERREGGDEDGVVSTVPGKARIDSVEAETEGAALALLFRGFFFAQEEKMPFEIRFLLGAGCDGIRYTSTFFYTGDPARDMIRGMGLRLYCPLEGPVWDRQIAIPADGVVFRENCQQMESRIPRTGTAFREMQRRGERVAFPGDAERTKLLEAVSADLPVWRTFRLTQFSDADCLVEKRTWEDCAMITARKSRRGDGVLGVMTPGGGVFLGLRDFWQRSPSALEASGLEGEEAVCTIWFKAMAAPSLDMRHYDRRSYPDSSYEGFEYFGADPWGIAATSEGEILPFEGWRDDGEVLAFAQRVQKPPVYVQDAELLRGLGAFGPWSLPAEEGPAAILEEQLEKAFDFYAGQVRQRRWYGFFDYGDVMHSYDSLRHTWKYDVGGYAWQNTELMPTSWLWYYFLRTGREDVFTMAEAMTRHASEIDSYHLGKYRGTGSRHNVRHWGCPCKEPRVSMALHHRVMYYLTGDRRLGACLRDTAHAEDALLNIPWYTRLGDRVVCRSGPDWTALLSDWMTEYERTLSPALREKAVRGMRGIMAAPMGMGSGTQFRFDPASGEMAYDGDQEGNVHLTLCFGALQALLEAADAMDLPELKKMAADYGRLYMMTPEERDALYGDMSRGRGFTMRYVAAAIGAYAGTAMNDPVTVDRAWHELMKAAPMKYDPEGFRPRAYARTADGEEMDEIPWISTNYISQWCLNVIQILAFAQEKMPAGDKLKAVLKEDYRLEL